MGMTLDEMREYCNSHADSIFVRDIVDGKVDTYSFEQLPETRREYWIKEWTKHQSAVVET